MVKIVSTQKRISQAIVKSKVRNQKPKIEELSFEELNLKTNIHLTTNNSRWIIMWATICHNSSAISMSCSSINGISSISSSGSGSGSNQQLTRLKPSIDLRLK